MPRCNFNYSQIEELLADVHRIAPAKRVAFQGRLKHFQRASFPTGQKPGKGRALNYTIEHLFKMVLAMELVQCGIPPKLAAGIVTDNWIALRTTIYLNTFSPSERREASADEADWCWLVRPEAMRELTKEGVSEYDQMEAIMAVRESELSKFLFRDFGTILGTGWRTLVVNGGPLVRGVVRLLTMKLNWVTTEDIRADFLQAMDEWSKRHSEGAAALKKTMDGWTPSKWVLPPVEERWPALIVETGREILSANRDLFEKLRANVGSEVRITANEIELLRDGGLVEINAEGVHFTDLGSLIMEMLEEEKADGKHP